MTMTIGTKLKEECGCARSRWRKKHPIMPTLKFSALFSHSTGGVPLWYQGMEFLQAEKFKNNVCLHRNLLSLKSALM